MAITEEYRKSIRKRLEIGTFLKRARKVLEAILAKICDADPRDYLRRVVMNDIRSPNTVTLPALSEAVTTGADG